MLPFFWGYVRNLSPSSNTVHWPGNTTTIDVYVNSTNTQGLSNALVQATALNSANQWNNISSILIRKNATSSSGQDGFNEIYFSTDPALFSGTGVVGVTAVTYKNNSGEIIEADILINDSFSFSSAITESEFLGNVLTHELGHFLGLGHSQVMGSSMFYALTRGQSQVSGDDKAGLYSIYPNGDSTKATLSGKVIGGTKLANVFGAHVEAVSVSSGKVEGAVISELDGTFAINGLTKDEQYFIYIKPIVNVGLPSKYGVARSNFCESNKSYRGSFFQSCGSSSEGYPQNIKLSSANVNVGNVTVRCGLDVPTDYIQSKGTTPATFDILSSAYAGVGNTFTGYFSDQELTQISPADYFRIDLSQHDPDTFSLGGDLYVELKVANQIYFSPFKTNVVIKRNSGTTTVAPKYNQETDGWLTIDTLTYIPISRADQSDNNLEIKIIPESMVFPSFPAGIPYTKQDLFPATDFEDKLNFYTVTASIVKDNGNGTYTKLSQKTDQLSDNTQCPDAVNTYSLTNYTVNGSSAATPSNRKKDDGFLGCGSIDLEGDSGSGPTGFFIGLLLSLLLCSLSGKFLNRGNARTIVQDGRS